MGLWRRVTRVFDALENVELDEPSAYGAKGEERAQRFLSEYYHKFLNRIVPHPEKKGRFLETDAIVYAEGNIFCVEWKRYKGKIYFPEYETKKVVANGYDDSIIIQEKVGKYGEGVFRKEHPNPLKKTKYYISHLKQFLSKIDERFSDLFIIAVVGFSDRDTDISAIHSMEKGFVYMSEIPEFIKRHRNKKSANSPEGWIINGLQQLPQWDRVLTRENEWLHGIILLKNFRCTKTDGSSYSMPYKHIRSVSISRKGAFSDHDDTRVSKTNGEIDKLASSSGQINLARFGEHQRHKLRNIRRICIGTQSLR